MIESVHFRFLFWGHLAATWTLVGLIWVVQWLQYPLFAQVGDSAFVDYHAAHSHRITFIVLPLMLFELISAFVLINAAPASIPMGLRWSGFALVLVIWLSTFALQVPQHGILGRGFDADAHRFLVASNWIRTVAWTLRGVLVLVMADRWLGQVAGRAG